MVFLERTEPLSIRAKPALHENTKCHRAPPRHCRGETIFEYFEPQLAGLCSKLGKTIQHAKRSILFFSRIIPKDYSSQCKINASVSTPYRYLIMIHAHQYKMDKFK